MIIDIPTLKTIETLKSNFLHKNKRIDKSGKLDVGLWFGLQNNRHIFVLKVLVVQHIIVFLYQLHTSYVLVLCDIVFFHLALQGYLHFVHVVLDIIYLCCVFTAYQISLLP